MKSLMTLVFAIVTVLAVNSEARQISAFSKAIEAYNKACQHECTAPYAETLIYSPSDRVREDVYNAIQRKIEAIAKDQAQVWADTILEGDYTAAGDTQVDHVTMITKEGRLLMYKVTYSETAWYTGECNYNGSENSLASCQQGRIYETSFVSAAISEAEVSENGYADFVE